MDVPAKALCVIVPGWARLNVSSPPKLSLPAGVSQSPKTLHQWVRDDAGLVSLIFVSSRAHTTFPSLSLCGIAKVVIGVVICLSLHTVPLLAADSEER
jgi:hypothetical protein